MSNTPSTNLPTVMPEQTGIAPTRAFEVLSPEEQTIVQSLVDKLDDYSDVSLIEFSSEASSASAREAEDFLKQTKLNDLEEFNECMNSLTRDLRSIDTKELSKQDPNPLARIPIIGSALAKSRVGKKVETIIEKQENVKKSIDLTVKTIEGIKLTLREDLIRCANTRARTIEFAKHLEYEYIALYQKRAELEKTYDEFISGPTYDPSNLDHSEYAARLQTGIQSIERKMDATLRYRVNAIQDIPSLTFVNSAETAMINTIDDCIKNVVPEWNKAFLKAILAYRVSNAADVMKSAKHATNNILTTSAQMTSNAIISAAEAIETPQIASETLEKKTEIFLAMCSRLTQISTEASKRRIDEAPLLKEMEKKSLVESSSRKTVPVISDSTGGNS